MVNDSADAAAGWMGFARSAGSRCNSASRCAASASWAVSSAATVRAVAADRPLASVSAVSRLFERASRSPDRRRLSQLLKMSANPRASKTMMSMSVLEDSGAWTGVVTPHRVARPLFRTGSDILNGPTRCSSPEPYRRLRPPMPRRRAQRSPAAPGPTASMSWYRATVKT
jgi:hypothetical protein